MLPRRRRPRDAPTYWAPLGVNQHLLTRMSRERQIAWLERSKQWPGLPKTAWRALKVLGSNGLCGLWKYIGSQKTARQPEHIVIKQSKSATLYEESKLMKKIQDAPDPTDHVVKLYRSCHSQGGSGTSPIFDKHPFQNGVYNVNREVHRIYIEYCEGGDLWSKIKLPLGTPYPAGFQPPEEYVWLVFPPEFFAIFQS